MNFNKTNMNLILVQIVYVLTVIFDLTLLIDKNVHRSLKFGDTSE